MSVKNQSGFAAVEILLVLILVSIVSFTGYYVWHSQKQTEKTLKVANDTAQTTTPEKSTSSNKYLTISEWKVKIPLSDDLAQPYYLLQSGDNNFVTLSLEMYKGTDCAADSVSLGGIQRFLSTAKNDSGGLLSDDYPDAVKIGNWNYSYIHPQAGCDGGAANSSNSPLNNTAAEKTNALMAEFKAATAGIVAAN